MLIEVPEERLAKASFVLLKQCKFFPSFAEIHQVLENIEAEEDKAEKEQAWMDFSGGKTAIELHLENREKRLKAESAEVEKL